MPDKVYDFDEMLKYGNDTGAFDAMYRDVLKASSIERHDDLPTQKRGIDKTVYLKDGTQFTVDEKKDSSLSKNICIETVNMVEWGVEGWLFKDECDYLISYFEKEDTFYMLPMNALREAYEKKKWSMRFIPKPIKNKRYTGLIICVPKTVILAEVEGAKAIKYVYKKIEG